MVLMCAVCFGVPDTSQLQIADKARLEGEDFRTIVRDTFSCNIETL